MKNKTYSTIKYFDLYGLRKEKGEFLESHDVKNTKWRELEPKEPSFWFVPKDMRGEKMYDKFISVKDIFKKYNAGIATGKDEVLVNFDKKALARKLMIYDKNIFEMTMRNYGVSEELIGAWYDELKNKDVENQIQQYNYRIFDKRFVIYNNRILQRSRDVIMKHLSKNNLALVATRILSSKQYEHIFISDCISDRCFISNRGREANYFFPLYLYNAYAPKRKKPALSYGNLMLFDKPKEKEPNIKAEIIEKLSESYKKKIAPEEIFYYIYAILYSNIYRKKYNEFLKIDFPKIPFAKDGKLFNKISKLGKKLADTHLLKSDDLESDKDIKFPAIGDSKAEKREYNEKEKRIYINGKQYFSGIAPEVWNYHIGGYQVLDKWLKDRKDKVLSSEDVEHYLKVITALKLTVELQKEIDKLYARIEKELIYCNGIYSIK